MINTHVLIWMLWAIAQKNVVVPYFNRILDHYFEEYIEKTLKVIVNFINDTYPISEKNFLKKYSYILKKIEKNSFLKRI